MPRPNTARSVAAMRNLLPQRFPRDRAPITKTLGAYGIPYALRDVGARKAVIRQPP